MSRRRGAEIDGTGFADAADADSGSGGSLHSDRLILDASAVLAILEEGPGSKEIEDRLGAGFVSAAIGAVNLAEVFGDLARRGLNREDIREATSALALVVYAFDEGMAERVGLLEAETQDPRIPLGARECVALARRLGATALTTEWSWERLEGVEVVGASTSDSRRKDSLEARNGG